MALDIEVKRADGPIHPTKPKDSDAIMGEYVYLRENEEGKIELHNDNKLVAVIPDELEKEVRDFKPLGAIITGIRGTDKLIISLLN